MQNTNKNENSPLARLRHHVTGAIERGEKTTIVAVTDEGKVPHVGDRIKLSVIIDRFPHFSVEAGATGTVNTVDARRHGGISVKMDAVIDGAKEWDNCIIWDDEEMDYFAEQTEKI